MLKKKMYKKEPEMLLGIDSTTHSGWKITQKVSFLVFYWTFVHSNVNLARFARNVECDFFYDFQTLWPLF